MTIRTLRHIHDLLIEEESKTERMLDWAREARNAAEDEVLQDPNDILKQSKLAKKREEYDAAYRKHADAFRALQDFQAHEF